MKIKIAVIAIFVAGIVANPAFAQKGFTKKSDAKNAMKNGQKNGNWVEYLDISAKSTTDTAAPYYNLTVYKNGVKNGMENEYTRTGKLLCSLPYKKGKLNGVAKYYTDGKLSGETSFKDDKMDGDQKTYDSNGKVTSTTVWKNGQQVAAK